jgi:hypothetical protein
MSSTLSPALAQFADGRWPDEREREPRAFAMRDIDLRHIDSRDLDPGGMEPPLHPSELDRFESARWSIDRWVPIAFVRFMVFFFVGVGTTLAWQAYGNTARRMAANWSPWLGWVAPPAATAAPVAPGSYAAGTAASPDQLAAISHSLAVVRQSVERLSADITRLQAAKQDPAVRTSGPPLQASPPAGHKPIAVQQTPPSR